MSTTRSAFATQAATHDSVGAIKKLSTLKGIGPAGASLLLSVCDPVNVPFFSDECFRWMMHEGSAKGRGWDRKIKYDVREYAALLDKVALVQMRLQNDGGRQISARDIERVAFVIGKNAVTASLPHLAQASKARAGRKKRESTPPSTPLAGSKRVRRSSRRD